MGARKRKGRARWFHHRRLVGLEVALLAGLGEEVLQVRVLVAPIPRWAKVALVMALFVGLLGALFLVIRGTSRAAVATAHDITRVLLLPRILAHGLFIAGIYYLYALHFHLWPVLTLP